MEELKEIQDLVLSAVISGDIDRKTHIKFNLQILGLGYTVQMLEVLKQQNLLLERQAEAMQQIANSLDQSGQQDRKL